MNSKQFLKALFFVAFVGITSTAWSQGAGKTGPKYDSAGEIKIKGTVEDIREVPGPYEGSHLTVKSGDKTILVHLAPADFLKEIEAEFKKGDQVEVVGAKVEGAPEEEILAREITVGNNTVVLRDGKGIPIWAGWKLQKTAGK